MEPERVTFAIVDRSAGYEATPDRVRLATLTEFARDVALFVRGDGSELEVDQLEVAIKSGSLAIETAPIVAPALFRDLNLLLTTDRLDSLDLRRREVLERWQKAARKSPQVRFEVSSARLARPVEISVDSDYHADDADQWVQVERYVRGEIEDLGGSTKANAHVRLPDGTKLTVLTDRELLRSDRVNRLYKVAMLRVRGRYNVVTRELRDARLVEFVEYAPSVDEEELARLTRRGAQAWKDVPDATEWIDDLRGAED